MLKIITAILFAALLLTGCVTYTGQPLDPSAPTEKALSAEDAKAIALEHAGLTTEQVTGLRAEYDRDDGSPQWEVEFRVDRTEYDYTIHAETGKILEWDKDIDD